MHPAWELDLPDPEATRALGRWLAQALRAGMVVGLLGDLGAGKTALAKAVVASLGAAEEDDVISPTFVLAVEYSGRVPVIHVDAYRLEGPAALEDLGLELGRREDRAALVEWADRVEDALPADRLTIELEHRGAGRWARVSAGGPRSAELLASLEAAARAG